MIKLRKLITGATSHGFDMQKHEVRVRDGGYTMVPLHVANSGQKWWKTMEDR